MYETFCTRLIPALDRFSRSYINTFCIFEKDRSSCTIFIKLYRHKLNCYLGPIGGFILDFQIPAPTKILFSTIRLSNVASWDFCSLFYSYSSSNIICQILLFLFLFSYVVLHYSYNFRKIFLHTVYFKKTNGSKSTKL